MNSVRGHQEEEEEEEEESGSKKDPSSNHKDGKNNDKANSIRSKHSVTEQRRRSKINERFQMLRDLIPHSDQKRDTASFLLEVIEYVQYLQEKVQKYEGSYQGWNPEPSKLMPWRNSHWRVQSSIGHPLAIKNGSGPGETFPGRFDENSIALTPGMQSTPQNPIESGPCKTADQQSEFVNRTAIPMPLQASASAPVQGDSIVHHSLQRPVSGAQSTECPVVGDVLNHEEDLIIEGGTISISSVYSKGLLNNLTEALQNAGVDLSQATISVRIDLGKRSNGVLTSGISVTKDPENGPLDQSMGHFRDASNREDADQAQKRLKIQA